MPLSPVPYTVDQSKDEIARLAKHFATNRAQLYGPTSEEVAVVEGGGPASDKPDA